MTCHLCDRSITEQNGVLVDDTGSARCEFGFDLDGTQGPHEGCPDHGAPPPRSIYEQMERLGVDRPRLKSALDGRDNWGSLVHSFVYLTVLGTVLDNWPEEGA